MFLRQLSSFGSSFLPRSRPALCRAGFRSSSASSSYLPHFIPAPHPWWSVRGFPPWPPRLPHSHPAAHQVVSARTLHPQSINPADFGGRRSFHTSTGLTMERPNRDREPPPKRRKSAEENRSVEEREGHRGAAAGGRDGGSKREHHHLDSRADSRPRSNHYCKDGSRDRGNTAAGTGVSRENSRDRYVGRTRTGDKHRQRKDSAGRYDPQNRGRSTHQQGGRKDSQPARTQPPKSKPEQDKVPMHKPNPWFKERGAEEQGRRERDTEGTAGQSRDRSSDGGEWPSLPSQSYSTTVPSNPWQVAGASRGPPPPGTSPSVRQHKDVKPAKSLHRHWETPACSTGVQPPGGSAAFDFSVMSYNILSQELLQDNAYLYRHCNPAILHWNHRLPNLLAEIQLYNADILCLQEVQEDHYENQIKPALQALGYQCEYKKRTGNKPDGCAVIFKSSRLSLLSSNPVEFFRPGDALLDRDNVGLVVLLQPNDTTGQSDPSAFICVANTHLLYNPRRGDIKLAQLAILLAEINRLSRLPDGSTNPVVLCGDFNSTPRSPLYSFLTTGSLDYRGLQISTVSGQENSPRGQRLLTSPIWSQSLGIDYQCQYKNKPTAESSCDSPTAVEGAISNLTVEDLANKAAVAFNRSRIEHGLKLQSSYQHHLMPDGRPEITTYHSRTAMTVDYILYTPESIAPLLLPAGRGLHLLGRLSLVGQSELEEVSGLPNHHHSSDHLPLLASFRVRR
ncbi:LOW QUALITY PROTEIN: protein angel homolog 2 [Dicentrarchus labrax]|uniref:LOW QUALITY PROTEIN: protein angel homolog 2 n=1 Tax=Dicentrarchus labrax TaxID=13489 RepID=UPI0021F65C75|nr:LOW QUALITY PROTEIN: protein angel homolog 2 [Dicentrarchus labrax]